MENERVGGSFLPKSLVLGSDPMQNFDLMVFSSAWWKGHLHRIKLWKLLYRALFLILDTLPTNMGI
jgi:hypothetical protein